jgi:hypothetical protein
MRVNWNLNKDEMQEKLTAARAAGHTRLFAIAYDDVTPVQWHSRKDESDMNEFLDSREESESMFFNCAIAVIVVNPADSDETIEATLTARQRRAGSGPGYFSEAF